MFIEKTFDTGEVRINYAEGPASGPPMVMLHGATVWWHDLQLLIDALPDVWHIYACDHRGHGKSGRATGHYRVMDYARDTIAFLQQQVAEPAVVVGHSLGGLVGLQAAAQLPQHVRALVLLDPPLELREQKVAEAPYHAWFSWVHVTVKSSTVISEITAKSKLFMPHLDDNGAAGLAAMLYAVDPECPQVIINDALLDGFDWLPTLQHITCPTLLTWGEKLPDDASAVRPSDVEFLCAHVARCTPVQIKDTGHGGHRDKPAEVAAHITAFLNELADA
jgi:pimeloyl-ACP methyl ester carboxylesterase